MKKTVAIIVLMFATSAVACPDLAGVYSCKSNWGQENMSIKQRKDGDVTVYEIEGKEFRADGASHTDSEANTRVTYTALCAADTLNMNLQADQNGITLVVSGTIRKVGELNLISDFRGVMTKDGRTENFTDVKECTRVQ